MDISDIQFDKYRSVSTDDLFKVRGKVVNVVGLTIESAGPSAKLGDICMIYPSAANAGSSLHLLKWLDSETEETC